MLAIQSEICLIIMSVKILMGAYICGVNLSPVCYSINKYTPWLAECIFVKGKKKHNKKLLSS